MKTAATLVTAIAACVLLSWYGPTVLDNSGENASAAAAIAEQKAAFRMAKAAVEICGENAAWTLTDKPGEILCVTKHGRRSTVAQVSK